MAIITHCGKHQASGIKHQMNSKNTQKNRKRLKRMSAYNSWVLGALLNIATFILWQQCVCLNVQEELQDILKNSP